ncbi:MAG TPA: glycosyltransferase, partial [Anaerolineaceae bacterium]
MFTRALFLCLGWFIVSITAALIWGRQVKQANLFLSLLWLLVVLALGDAWAVLTFGVPLEMAWLTVIALANGLVWITTLRGWNPLGKTAWSMTFLTTLAFIVYSFNVTAFTPMNPLSFVLAIVFFLIESLALLLGLSHAFESLEVITRARWRRAVPPFTPDPAYHPKVSLQVPTYNEPPEVVAQTLETLARLDYPNYEVLVVDNNTPDEATWRAVEAVCRRLGPRFRILHLDKWPGFKSGALNFALTQTAPDAEIIGVVDADYQIEPNFLKEIVPAFQDPRVAFVQTPQDYREARKNSFNEIIYHGYKYFFEVSMPVRNEHNAIIFCGTMGLLRRSVLEEIGGWDEWCITEDAEASLRILKRGYTSLYIHKTYGKGLMPFSFDGLKKQRFRWGFGGIQILRKHWEALMPWSRDVDPNNHLTGMQKYYYLLGGLQWFTDVFNLLFS